MPEELRFLLRSAAYSLFVGVAYWFLSYEWAGTLLLVGLGVAAGLLFAFVLVDWRGRGNHLEGPAWRWPLLPPASEESGTTDESGRLPRPTLAPVTLGLGLGLLALGLVFGIWFAAASVVPIVIGIRGWLRDAMAEYDAVASE